MSLYLYGVVLCQSSVKMKLLCGQIVKDLLGEQMDVSLLF